MRKKFFWKKGGGEIIGFLMVLPVILFMLVLFVAIVQIGSIKERLEYTAYLAARQVVVVSDEDDDGDYLNDAEKIAKKIAKEDLKKSGLKYKKKSVKVTVDLLGDEEELDKNDSGKKKDKTSKKKTIDKADKKTNSEDEVLWEKGNYARVTVSVEVKSAASFMNGIKSASIVMMIESPAAAGGSYPWFDNI